MPEYIDFISIIIFRGNALYWTYTQHCLQADTAMTWIVPPIVVPLAIGLAAALYAMLSGA